MPDVTPQERALNVVRSFYAERGWHFDDSAAVWEIRIATAIGEAEAAARAEQKEADAKIASDVCAALYEQSKQGNLSDRYTRGAQAAIADQIAAVIRGESKP